MARHIGRSLPGSVRRTPPTADANTSCCAIGNLARRSSTASNSASLPASSPCALRRGGTPELTLLVSACTSTSSGRCPSSVGVTAEPGDAGAAVGEEQAAGVGNPDQAALDHLEHAQLVGGPEAMLDRAQQAQRVMAVAFEAEHGVDDVLEHPRPGEAAVFGDMADEHDRRCRVASPRSPADGRSREPARRCPAPSRGLDRRPTGCCRR